MILGISGKAGSGKDTVGLIVQMLTSSSSVEECKESFKVGMFGYSSDLEKWQIKKFAYAVKQICSILTGIPVSEFEKEEVKSSYLGEEWKLPIGIGLRQQINYPHLSSTKSFTVRQLLQLCGTDAMRDVIHPDVWVNALMKDYKLVPNSKNRDYLSINGKMEDVGMSYDKKEYPNWIISDVRFGNEAKAIKDRGGVVVRVDDSKRVFGNIHDELGLVTKGAWRAASMGFEHESETALDSYSFDYVIENDSDIPSLIEKVKEMLKHYSIL